MQAKEKKNEIKKGWSKKTNSLQKHFHSSKYIIDHMNVPLSSM